MNTTADHRPTTAQAVTLHPVRATDSDAMQRFVQGLDNSSRRLRFHAAVNACAPGLLRHLTQVDGVRHVAFVACVEDGIVGEARYFVDAHDTACAEFAIVVADAVRGCGIADELLQALVDSAQRAGVTQLHGEVLNGNERMAGFMRRNGFAVDAHADTDAGVSCWQRSLPLQPKAQRAIRSSAPAWPVMLTLQTWWHKLGRQLGSGDGLSIRRA